VEPRLKHGMPGQFPGIAGERRKDLLNDISGATGISAGAPKSSAVDEIDVTVDQFAEGGLGPVVGIAPEQRGVIVHWFHHINNAGPETEH